jgi:hypothetical protein
MTALLKKLALRILEDDYPCLWICGPGDIPVTILNVDRVRTRMDETFADRGWADHEIEGAILALHRDRDGDPDILDEQADNVVARLIHADNTDVMFGDHREIRPRQWGALKFGFAFLAVGVLTTIIILETLN